MLKILGLSLLLTLLVACSSGGGGGSPGDGGSSKASSSSSVANKESSGPEMVKAAVDTVVTVVLEEEGSIGIPITAAKPDQELSYAPLLSLLPTSAVEFDEETEVGVCGGNIHTKTKTTSPDNSNELFPLVLELDQTYNDYCWTEGFTADGEVSTYWVYHSLEDWSYVIKADLVYSGSLFGVDGYRYQFLQDCSYSSGVSTCDDGSWYEGSSGSSYELKSVSVSESNDVYSVSGTFTTDDSQVEYQLNAENLSVCDNGNFGSGSITLTINGSEYISIEFMSCSEYSYYFDGATGIVSQ